MNNVEKVNNKCKKGNLSLCNKTRLGKTDPYSKLKIQKGKKGIKPKTTKVNNVTTTSLFETKNKCKHVQNVERVNKCKQGKIYRCVVRIVQGRTDPYSKLKIQKGETNTNV